MLKFNMILGDSSDLWHLSSFFTILSLDSYSATPKIPEWQNLGPFDEHFILLTSFSRFGPTVRRTQIEGFSTVGLNLSAAKVKKSVLDKIQLFCRPVIILT